METFNDAVAKICFRTACDISEKHTLSSLYWPLLDAPQAEELENPAALIHERSIERYLRGRFRDGFKPLFLLADEREILGELKRRLQVLSHNGRVIFPHRFRRNQTLNERLIMARVYGRWVRNYVDQHPVSMDPLLLDCVAAAWTDEWSRLGSSGEFRLTPEDEPAFLAAGRLSLWHFGVSNEDHLLYHGIYPKASARTLIDALWNRAERFDAAFGQVRLLQGFDPHQLYRPQITAKVKTRTKTTIKWPETIPVLELREYTHLLGVAADMVAVKSKEEAERIARERVRKGEGAKAARQAIALHVEAQDLSRAEQIRVQQVMGASPEHWTDDPAASLKRSARRDVQRIARNPPGWTHNQHRKPDM